MAFLMPSSSSVTPVLGKSASVMDSQNLYSSTNNVVYINNCANRSKSNDTTDYLHERKRASSEITAQIMSTVYIGSD